MYPSVLQSRSSSAFFPQQNKSQNKPHPLSGGTMKLCRAVLVLCLAVSATAFAQFRTSIQGVVTDSSGAILPGAKLTLKNLNTNQTLIRTSGPDGVYNFNALPADPFTLTAEKDGFQSKVLDHLQLTPEQPNGVNVELEPGGQSTTVTVNADTIAALDTQTANTTRTITTNEIQHTPVYQRDPTSLIRLVPGVLADGAQKGGGG